jgi:hypothetical protein
MDIGDWQVEGHRTELFRELRLLGLEPHLAELDAFGFTVVTPEHAGTADLAARTLEAVLALAERRSGVRPDVETGASHQGMHHPLGQHMRFVLWEDPVFEEVLMQPHLLGLVSWLVGVDGILSLANAVLKGPGDNRITLHTDEQNKTVPVYSEHCTAVNATFLLTDYTEEGGALAFLPGSHRRRRDPSPAEAIELTHVVPVVAPAGSLVVWGSHTWHASYPRRIPGLRGTLFFNVNRWHTQTEEPYRDTCTQEALDRNPRRFAWLMDQFGVFPHKEEDVDYARAVARGGYPSLLDAEPTKGSVVLRSALPPRGVPALAQPPGASA